MKRRKMGRGKEERREERIPFFPTPTPVKTLWPYPAGVLDSLCLLPDDFFFLLEELRMCHHVKQTFKTAKEDLISLVSFSESNRKGPRKRVSLGSFFSAVKLKTIIQACASFLRQATWAPSLSWICQVWALCRRWSSASVAGIIFLIQNRVFDYMS